MIDPTLTRLLALAVALAFLGPVWAWGSYAKVKTEARLERAALFTRWAFGAAATALAIVALV